MFMSKA